MEYWDAIVAAKLNVALVHITLKAPQTFCDYLLQHLNFLYCCFKLLPFGYLGIRGTAEQSVGALKEGSILCGLFVLSIGLGLLPCL